MPRYYGEETTACNVESAIKTQAYGMIGANGPPDAPELQQALGQIDGLREVLLETRSALQEFIARTLGAEHESEGMCAEGNRAFNSGLIGKLRLNIDDTRDIAGDVRALARRLPQIA